MSRRKLLLGGLVLVLVVAALSLWAYQKRRDDAANTPDWTDPRQPAEGTAGQPTAITADQSWAANRAVPMVACCEPYTAGRRVRRTYAPTLTESDCSFVRAFGGVELG